MANRAALIAAVGEGLFRHRTGAGRDLDEVAASARIDVERLQHAEDGDLALGAGELDRLAAAYGVDVTAFFGGRTTPLAYLAGA
ncbi:MAG: hypothetical protein NVSMB64_33150 [Candidatus Velthaea sp.]